MQLLFSTACVVLATDVELSAGAIQVKVLGRSGKIAIYRNINVTKREGNETKTKVKRNGVLFDFDSIKEKDKDGNEVGAKGKDKHSFNGFAKLDFTFSGIKDGKLQNVSVKWFSFEAKKIGAAEGSIKVIIYLIKEDGEIDIGKNESEKLSKGSVKFSVKVSVDMAIVTVACQNPASPEILVWSGQVCQAPSQGKPRQARPWKPWH